MEPAKRNRLQTFLHARSVTERSLLLMYYADQLTPHEISVVLNVPLSEVVRRLASLIAAARAALAPKHAVRDHAEPNHPDVDAADPLVA